MTTREIRIGNLDEYEQFPAQVSVEKTPYFLVKDGSSFRLLSVVCPHAGGRVSISGDLLFCPSHFWSFDSKTGECTTIPGYKLGCHDVIERDGILYAIQSIS